MTGKLPGGTARGTWRAVALLVLLSVPWAGAAPAADMPPAGAAACSGCHLPALADGPVPRLAGRPAAEIAEQMQAFRSGARPATVMDRIAKGFTDDEIRRIAAWFERHPAKP